MALAFTACDEGTPPPVEPPPPPTPVGTISGTVTVEGTAASGITATLSSGATTTTGSGGSFAFSGVEAGTYTVTISGFPEDATFAQVTQSATIATDGQNVQLNFAGEYIRSSAVVGNVVAADAMMSGGDGQPETLAGVTVTLGGEHAMGETMETDETGGFAFTGLRAGTYTVTISDYPEDVSFETVMVEVPVDVGDVGQADFTGHFIRTSAVAGQVIIEGEGLAGVTVTLSGGPADESFTMMTDADGMYRFDELRPGDYTVSIADFDPRDYEFAATSQDVSVDLDETGTVSFTGVLLRTSGISGRVSVEGMGLGDIAVTLSGAADDTTMTDASGQYAFAGLAAGDYTVSIAVESNAYVFDSMSQDKTVGDDESAIVNFEGAHDTSATLTAMLFIDEASKNDEYDEGEDAFPSAAMLAALQAAQVALPPMLPVPVTLVGPEVNQMRSGTLNVATGQVSFSGLRAGSYHLQVGSLSALLAGLPPQVAAVLQDYEYGGPSDGYAIEIDVGEMEMQAVPVDITHTTVHFAVMLRHGDDTGHPVPGAAVTLYSGENSVGSGTTGENGEPAMIRFARTGTSDNMVNAGVAVDGLHVADGMTPVPWDPKSPHTAAANANDIVNLNVAVSVSGATITTDYGGGVELANWAITVMSGEEAVEDAPEALGEDGNTSFGATVDAGDLPVMYSFAVAEEQDDDLDGGEEVESESVEYEHDGLSLTGGEVALEASFATQTLKVYVHHERDQVKGFTGNVLGGDLRMSGMVDIEVRYVADNGRTRAFTKDMWDAAENTTDSKGVLTFSGVPADMNVIVTARAAEDNVMLSGAEQLAAYEDFEENGVSGSAFGDLGGFHHTVELCPLQDTNPTGQDHGDCASFAFVSAFTVDGQAWKNEVKKDSGDDFGKVNVVGVEGTAVTLDPVAGKNLEGESEEFEAAGSDDKSTDDIDETKQFDFGRMADGVYEIGVPAGWVATAGMGGDKLSEQFLLRNNLTSDEDEDDADDHLNIDVTPSTGVLYGRVTDDAGLPAEGVTVDVNGQTDVTDESGRYIVEGFSGRRPPRKPVLVQLSGTGYASKTDSTTVSKFAANSPTRQDFELTGIGDFATFSGIVTKSGGGVVSGVTISVTGSTLINPNAMSRGATEDDIYQTDDNGAYSVQVRATGASVILKASKKDLSFSPEDGHSVSATADQDISGLNFTAFDHAMISGRVLNEDGGPERYVKITATRADDDSRTYSDVSSRTGTFTLSVPYGVYVIGGDAESGYTFEYPNGITRVNVAPGQRLAYGDIEATVSATGRPPRFTSSASFSVEEGETDIGTVEAVDPDDDDATITYSGSSDDVAVASDGDLVWVGTAPAYDDDDDDANDYKLTVTATSTDDLGTNSTDQNVTVTVTESGDAVVTLVVTPDEIVEGGSSTVSATLASAASSPFSVNVSVTADDNARGHRVSTNKSLFFNAGDKESSGAPVTITSSNDNVHTGDQTLTVTGTVEGADDMTVKSVELTVTDNDVPNGQVRLVLKRSRIDETDDAATTGDDNQEAQDTLTATLAGGTTFEEDITIAVTVSPAGVVTPADTDADADGHQIGTLTILAGSRSSTLNDDGTDKTTDATIVIEAVGDNEDEGNTVVTVSGVVSVGGTALDDDHDSQPNAVSLIILDDDAAPGAPQNIDASVDDAAADADATVTVEWDAPSSLGEVNGTAPTAAYEYRFEEASVIGRESWTAVTATPADDGSVEMTITVAADSNLRGRTVTVQVRTTSDAGQSSPVPDTVDVPAGT